MFESGIIIMAHNVRTVFFAYYEQAKGDTSDYQGRSGSILPEYSMQDVISVELLKGGGSGSYWLCCY